MIRDAITANLPFLRAEAEMLMVDTCVRRRYIDGAVNDYGNPSRTAVDVTLSCRKRPAAGSEDTVDRDVQTHEVEFHFAHDADVAGGDDLIHDGVTWQVVGPPIVQSWPVRLRAIARRSEAL